MVNEDGRMKEIYPSSLKNLVKESVAEYLKSNSEDYEELKYVLKPAALKAEVRRIIQTEIENFQSENHKFIKNIASREVSKKVYGLKREVIEMLLEEFPKEEMKKLVKKHFSSTLATSMKPILVQSLKLVNLEMNKKVSAKMKQLINLKTSTISEVSSVFRKIGSKTDDEYVSDINMLCNEKEDELFEGDKKYIQWFKDSEEA